MAKHVHAEKMAMFAKDAKISETPWEFWEVSESKVEKDGDWVDVWEDLNAIPDWNPNVGYRRKVRTTTIEGIEFPIPYKGEVVEGQTYYYANFGGTGYIARDIENYDEHHEALIGVLLACGNLFLTEEEARMRVKALRELDRKILCGKQ